ncbi:DUF4304 domain-containing protein [Nocardioides albidus]|uniref:DUF4304 domain-containing protein n=1 Tax=Nocardioides albidus TaxID=1517589 RepID=A0A5C4VYX7_9ACTN|nr:DUF4304 domain-containing protein [Nocardioides albidus]TNM41133.1 DUF4304 domain-containing protein [Nocardioides albidus]
MATAESEQMAAIVATFAPLMKQQGFRKRRHCFNRTMDSGLVHVANFWQHPKEPAAWTEVSGLRERRYGTFRLDFGVYVPEIKRGGSPRSDWINDYNCHLRRTAGQLEGAQHDMWLPIDDPESVEHTQRSLEEFGFPWLARFASHDAVLDEFHRYGAVGIGMSPAGGLDIADMLIALGRQQEARSVLEGYVSRSVLKSHGQYLSDYLRDRGHPDLVDRIQTHEPTPS